jgi:hypothetical protein
MKHQPCWSSGLKSLCAGLALCWCGHATYGQMIRIPRHGLGIGLSFSWQLPGKVQSLDGSDGYVSLSDWTMGMCADMMYNVRISERTGAGVSFRFAHAPINFVWSGDQEPLGTFGGTKGKPVGVPLIGWDVSRLAGELQTILAYGGPYMLTGTAGAGVAFGSGSSSFAWQVDRPDGLPPGLFKVEAALNSAGKVMPFARTAIAVERILKNQNRLTMGVGATWGLLPKALEGTYHVHSLVSGYAEGTFSSSLSTVEWQMGYVFSWGYPKVSKRMRK